MSYGELKIDTITFTAGGVDTSVSVSGLVQNPTFTGNITTTGTISGDVIKGNTVSGATVTGDTGEFGNLTAVSGVFTTQVSGATVTGDVGLFGTITGGIHTLTSGVFASGTAANPSITFVDDLDTGLFTGAANTVSMVASGAAVLTVTGTNVGIGTANPAHKLVISNGGVQNIEFNWDSVGSSNYIQSYNRSTSAYLPLTYYASEHKFHFAQSQFEAARIDSSARLLVGTNSEVSSVNPSIQTARSNGGFMAIANSDTITDADTTLGQIAFYGKQSSVYCPGSTITAISDATWSSSSDTPSRLVFATTADGNSIPTDRMTIKNDGTVGIGTTSPGSLLEVAGKTVVGSTSSNALEVFSSGDTEIGFSYSTRGNIYAKIIGDITVASPLAGEIAFQTATGGSLSERARIDSSGYLRLTSNSPGIQFNGDTAAANALDDYEEGLWTPTVGGTATYTSQVGRYTKIGRMVHLVGVLVINTIGTGSQNTVSGLPFTNGTSGQATVNINYYSSSNATTTWIAGYVEPSTSYFRFSGNDGNATTADSNISFLTASTAIYFSLTYQV